MKKLLKPLMCNLNRKVPLGLLILIILPLWITVAASATSDDEAASNANATGKQSAKP